ncbi:MAG: hypothetical protein RI891_1159, partial [Gemmatimonadota bacterium]
MSLHVWSSAHYTIPLPDGHRFPITMYARLREAIVAEGIVAADRVHDPERLSLTDAGRVHDADYLSRVLDGRLSAAEQRRMGFPWSPGLVERSLRASGGTVEAARHALAAG